MKSVGVYVSRGQYPPNADDAALVTALTKAGARPVVEIWDDWNGEAYDHAVIRSTWDYAKRPEEFKGWLGRVAAVMPLHNPLETVLWSFDKRYLLELEDRGIPTIPQVLGKPTQASVKAAMSEMGWTNVVVKSVVSAGGRQIVRVQGSCCDAVRQLPQRFPVLIQPFLPEFSGGEYSVICIDGSATHSVLKRPAAGEYRVQEHYGGSVESVPTPRVAQELALEALEMSNKPWTYARADIVLTADGPLLVELEMLEPELFLQHSASAAALLAERILRS